MAAVETDLSLLAQLKLLVPWLSTLRIALFVNDYHPLATSRWYDFQEATFGGYAQQLLDEWALPYLLAGPLAKTEACVKTWTYNGAPPGQTVYGYYVLTPQSWVAWAERGPTPRVLSASGQLYTVQPVRTLRGEFTM